ncbi:MAG: SDR family NAD(P)-dependent oxidoreductase [Acidimicrobiales bacterium]
MEQLEGRVAIVTGAASGIGLAMAHAFAAEGMKVVLADVDEPGLASVLGEITAGGGQAVSVPTDVSDSAQVDALRQAALAAFGGAHVICNNAGVAVGGPLWDVPLESWKWVFGVNFWGVVHGIRSFAPLLREQGAGHIVNTASAAGIVSTPWLGPYSATKHAVVALSETLALELAGSGVGVSVLCPMWVKTRIHESDRNAPAEVARLVSDEQVGAMRSAVGALVATGAEPSHVAGLVVKAVKEDTFYVFPHDQVREAARRRGQRIADGKMPDLTLFS